MSTRISRFADGLMEACWLAALVVAPVFFDVFSSRIFEPDKITLLRTLALLILAVWLVKAIDLGGLASPASKLWAERLKAWLRTPLVPAVLFLALVYLIATLFSVTPRTSLFGSYQRLQGTYTTFSYLVIFAAVGVNLRRRKQIDRIISVALLASLPVALYGILQHYHLDPIPWGGDVSRRIASTLGNSIFIAAYLIMVFPLALGRIFESFRAIVRASTASGAHPAGTPTQKPVGIHVQRGAIYVFLAVLQLTAIYMSGSRGPVLGLMAAVFFIFLMLAVQWRAALSRWLTFGLVGGVLLLGALLLVFNLEGGPLEALRASPAIGRFGLLLNADSNSALVRRYIWEGAAKLVAPHAPLVYPDGSQDRFNLIRPLVGYGPESMFVASNPFYNPLLGQVERRNAAPDRSHNETWDSLVNAGLLGLVAYLWLFTSIFYYGLKWLGLIGTPGQKRWFFALYAVGGFAGGVIFTLWRGVEYLGVGLPFGLLLGLFGFVMFSALQRTVRPRTEAAGNEGRITQALLLTVLLAAILGHFVEINFGIAISVTRTYFWVYTALLMLVGYVLPQSGVFRAETAAESTSSMETTASVSGAELKPASVGGKPNGQPEVRKSRRTERMTANRRSNGFALFSQTWINEALAGVLVVGMLLATLGFDLIANQTSGKTALTIFWQSITNLQGTTSYGILALLVTTWLVGSALMVVEADFGGLGKPPGRSKGWWKSLGVILLGSLAVGGLFWLWQSASLAAIARTTPGSIAALLDQISRYEDVLTHYYVYLILILLGLAFVLPGASQVVKSKRLLPVAAAAAGAILLFVALAVNTNLRVVQADITFKLAGTLAQPGSYPVAIQVYQRANQLAPNEDYYYLYLGRTYLDEARSLTTASERDALLSQAAQDLRKAQSLNPLNTDHTANLARLYSLWASYAQDASDRSIKAEQSDQYFAEAVALSPQNVRLWNEWAYLATSLLDQPEQAQARLERALQIDTSYDWTYGQLGDLLVLRADSAQTDAEKTQLLQEALANYQKSLSLQGEAQLQYNYGIASGGVLTQLGRISEAITAYEGALKAYPQGVSAWRVQQVLAQLYAQIGDLQSALQYANAALVQAPSDQKSNVQSLIDQLKALP